jgi:hypothetical protein
MTRTMVRYRVRSDQAALNEKLIRAVFDELRSRAPEGFRYQVFVLDDGVSFVHIVEHEPGANPLPEMPAFKRYTAAVRERCQEQPLVTGVRVLGSVA